MRFYPESTSNSAALPYRYNGKELEAMNGLNQMDYGARRRGTGLPAFTSVDPLAEMDCSISPYAYCHDNPVNRIDPTGKVDILPDGAVVCTAPAPKNNNNNYYNSAFLQLLSESNRNTLQQTPRITIPTPSTNLSSNVNNPPVSTGKKDSKKMTVQQRKLAMRLLDLALA